MNSIKKKTYLPIFIYTVCLLLLVLATFYDLNINQSIHNKNSTFAVFFRWYGELPAYISATFLGAFIFIKLKRRLKTPWLIPLFFIIWLAPGALIYFFIGHFNNLTLALISSFGGGLIVVIVTLFGLSKCSHTTINKLFIIVISAVILSISSNILTIILKDTWGRVRFNDLSNNFTKWYQINGNTGNRSFPSGHVTAASAILAITLIPQFLNVKKAVTISLYLFCALWIISTAISRLIIGAHYLSDVVAAFALTYTQFLIIKHYAKKKLLPKIEIN